MRSFVRHACLAVAACALSAVPALACADFGLVDSYRIVSSNKLLLSFAGQPKALVDIGIGCFLTPGSRIGILKRNFVCSFEDSVFVIDDEVCDAGAVQSLN